MISKLSTCILRLLISTILRSKSDAVYAFGLVCSSFVSVSRGSTFRHYFLPLGDPSSASAQLGNLLCARSPRVGNIRYHIVGYIYHIYIYIIYVGCFSSEYLLMGSRDILSTRGGPSAFGKLTAQ